MHALLSLPLRDAAAPLLARLRALMGTHGTLLGWVTALSAVMIAVSVVALPWAIARLPADYFTEAGFERRQEERRASDTHPTITLLLHAGRNVLGVIVFFAGVAMLILPGQGILAILVGVLLVDYPGKHRLERKLVAKPAIYRPLNWVRRRAHKAPFVISPDPQG